MSSRIFAESVTETVRESLLVLDINMKVISANKSYLRTFHVAKEGVEGRNLYTLGNRQWDIPELRKLLDSIISKKKAFEDFQVEHNFPDIGHRVMLLNARQIVTDRPDNGLILLAIEDITGK